MGVSLSLSITQNSQNKTALTSNVTVAVEISWTYGSYNGFNPSGTLTIDDVPYGFNANFNYENGNGPVSTNGSATLYTKTVDVAHNPDGTKIVYCDVSYAASSSNTATAYGEKELTPIAVSGGSDSENSAGVVYIERSAGVAPHTIHIDNGTGWDTYVPYIDTGTSFELYG